VPLLASADKIVPGSDAIEEGPTNDEWLEPNTAGSTGGPFLGNRTIQRVLARVDHAVVVLTRSAAIVRDSGWISLLRRGVHGRLPGHG
jgi:hypothetical protein